MKLELCGGCNAKMSPLKLQDLLAQLPPSPPDPQLLCGFEAAEDASVYALSEDLCLVQSIDFFPPLIDDPYLFGQIAAVHALSDLYAMGARPITALNLVCWPEAEPLEALADIMKGGSKAMADAGIAVSGGHSIQDKTLKFGYSVTGLISREQLLRNQGAKPGDHLIVTKALGIGLLCSARLAGALTPEQDVKLCHTLLQSNAAASTLALQYRAQAATDVTGFGLVGHALEMLSEDLALELYSRRLPALPGVEEAAREVFTTAGQRRNEKSYRPRLESRHNLNDTVRALLFDPQTSGGLLVAVPSENSSAFLRELVACGHDAQDIGTFVTRQPAAPELIIY